MRRVWDKLGVEDPNLDNPFNVIEQQFVSQIEKDPKSVVLTAKGNPPGAGNNVVSGSKASSTKSGNKPESPGPSANVDHRKIPNEAHSHTGVEELHKGSTEDKLSQAPPSFPAKR